MSKEERERAAADLMDLMETVGIGGNQAGSEIVVIEEMRAFLNPEEIEETEESVGIEGRMEKLDSPAAVRWRVV